MTVSEHASARLAKMLSSASVEISSRGHQLTELRSNFAPGTDVTITFLPGDNYRRNVETAAMLRRAGFNPVPHIAVREMPSREALDDFLARARGDADVTRILLIAGDVAAARGPFKSTRDVCGSGLLEAHGIASVSVAGHPEGHPYLELPDALDGLKAWRDWGRQTGTRVDIVTQFCFESAPDPAMDGRTRSRRHRSARHRRPGRAGHAGDTDKVRAPLRHRQFDARAAGPDRPVRPAADRYRTGRRGQGIALLRLRSQPRRSQDFTCFRSAACARPATGCAPRDRDALGHRAGRDVGCRVFKIRKTEPDCRPGSACGRRVRRRSMLDRWSPDRPLRLPISRRRRGGHRPAASGYRFGNAAGLSNRKALRLD